MPWTKCLPLALLRIRTAPRRDVGIAPYEQLFGLPYLSANVQPIDWKYGNEYINQNVRTVSQTLQKLREKGQIPQSTKLEFDCKFEKLEGIWRYCTTHHELALRKKSRGTNRYSQILGESAKGVTGSVLYLPPRRDCSTACWC